METEIKMEVLITSQRKPIDFLKYEPVYQIKQGIRYLRSFNLIGMSGEIIKKYYLKEPILSENILSIEKLICEYFFTDIMSNKTIQETEEKKRPVKKKITTNKINAAAFEILKDLGL